MFFEFSQSRKQTLLPKREDDFVNLVFDGLPDREVPQKLGLAEHTVSNYQFRIYEKLGISTRVELVLCALRQKQQV
jgi:DNA-binding NarL/FixJ family response regulator